jgi:hypothetical protein
MIEKIICIIKNNLSTLGDHFHFTAFGIDWLEEKWTQGLPPTYLEYANMWQEEYQFRKANGATPKEEWAYINFVQRYLSANKKGTREEILQKWDIERNLHKDRIKEIFILKYDL